MTETESAAPEFVVTKEYRRFAEFCDACRQYRYIGVCHGAPGVGKTLSARYYTHWDQLDPILHDHFDQIERPAEMATWRSLLYTPAVLASPKRTEREITGYCKLHSFRIEEALHPDDEPQRPAQTYTELILIGEADRLKLLPLEQVRDTYDWKGIGIVLVGMPGLQKRLSRYPQLYSRVGFVPSPESNWSSFCSTSGGNWDSRSPRMTSRAWRRWPRLPASPTGTSAYCSGSSVKSSASWRSMSSRKSLTRWSRQHARAWSSAQREQA